jgi:glycosyltransferase involved in cell wall biosynthesis
VLTSRFEGFSLVLLEAMKHGIPCVTFDCQYVPRDVVEDKKSGYVVENDNTELFIHKVSELIDHPETRKAFSEAAIVKAKTFNKDIIMRQWKALFESLVKDSSNSPS